MKMPKAHPDEEFVQVIFSRVLGRQPTAPELAYGLAQLAAGREPKDYFFELAEGPDAQAHLLSRNEAPMFVPPGHFYSPVVNTAELGASEVLAQASGRPILEVDLEPNKFLQYFQQLSRHFDGIQFPVQRRSDYRYYFENEYYSYGDALILSAMIREHTPRQIVEVGSGFSSAVILDTLDRMSGANAVCTFIEPYPDRLRSLLRDEDSERVRILETGIQSVDLELFEGLDAGDIVFFDTTHISKTGSDVNHEVFEILPRLKKGVIVHFHDIFHHFEYPRDWILKDNRSWNEIYLLRAFLMGNDAYEVIFFNDEFAQRRPSEAQAISPLFMKNPGGGLWMRKQT